MQHSEHLQHLKHLRQYLSKIRRATVLVITGLALAAGPILGPCSADLFTSYAAPAIEHTAKAEALAKLNMFTKSAKGFELERPATRLEAVETLVLLLGKTAEIKAGAGTFSHPFTDVPAQGADAVGYLFTNGYLSDNAAHTFKPSDKMDMNTYCAMLLQAMGYKIENGDYTWATAVDFAVKAGLLNANEVKLIKAQGAKGLMRDELALMSYNALKAPLNPAIEGYKGKSLVDLGIAAKTVNTEAAVMAGIAKMATYDEGLRKPIYDLQFKDIVVDGVDQDIKYTDERRITDANGTEVIDHTSTSLLINYEEDYPDLIHIATFCFDREEINKVESIAEYTFFKSGKEVMSGLSDIHHKIENMETHMGYYMTTPKVSFDEVRVQVYEMSDYELYRKFGNIPTYSYTMKQVKEGIAKLRTADFVTTSSQEMGQNVTPHSATSALFVALYDGIVLQPGKSPFIVERSVDLKGKKSVANGFMRWGKLVGKKNIQLVRTNSTSYFSAHYVNNMPNGDYTLSINPKATAFFILRDAKYNPIGVVTFKP